MVIKRILLLTFLSGSLFATETCFFVPPAEWEVANPDLLHKRVHICFLGKNNKGLAPSINLATEPVTISLEGYIEEVRKIHKADPNSRWRDLGKFKTPLGEGRLTELETTSEQGKARIVQLIVIKDQLAYILTAGALKEEFSKYYKTFDQVFHSLQLSSNLIESYPNPAKHLPLQEEIQKLQNDFSKLLTEEKKPEDVLISEEFQTHFWKPFEKKIINDFTEMGSYWQILLLQETQTKLLTMRSSNEEMDRTCDGDCVHPVVNSESRGADNS